MLLCGCVRDRDRDYGRDCRGQSGYKLIVFDLSQTKLDIEEFKLLKQQIRDDTFERQSSFQKVNAKISQIDKHINLIQPLDVFNRMISSLDFVLCRREERERLVQYFDPIKDEILTKIQLKEGLQLELDKEVYKVPEKPIVFVEWLHKELPPPTKKRRKESTISGSSNKKSLHPNDKYNTISSKKGGGKLRSSKKKSKFNKTVPKSFLNSTMKSKDLKSQSKSGNSKKSKTSKFSKTSKHSPFKKQRISSRNKGRESKSGTRGTMKIEEITSVQGRNIYESNIPGGKDQFTNSLILEKDKKILLKIGGDEDNNEFAKGRSEVDSEVIFSLANKRKNINKNYKETEFIRDDLEEGSEGGESEANWRVPKEEIKEMITDSILEAEKGFRMLLDEKVTQELQQLRSHVDNKFEVVFNNAKEFTVNQSNNILEKLKELDNKTLQLFENNFQKQKEYEQMLLDYMGEQKIKRKRDKNDFTSNISKLTYVCKENTDDVKKLAIEMFNITETLKVIIEAEKINQSLQLQDEIDRHSIALWGMNKTTKNDKTFEKIGSDQVDSPTKLSNSGYTNLQNFLNSSREFPNPSTKTNKELLNTLMDSGFNKQISDADKQRLEALTQRSLNFASVGKRKSISVQKGTINPIHYKRSLPQIIQTKNSK